MAEIGRPVINEIGNRYGLLEVVSQAPYSSYDRATRWHCRCACGRNIIAVGTRLRSGRTTHCGCQTNLRRGLSNTLDLTGKNFNNLVAIRNTWEKKHGCYVWECECICGKKIYCRSTALMTGKIKSCGCGKVLPNNMGPINRIYRNYIYDAERRKIEFNLSLHKFIDLITSNCVYCGAPPVRVERYQCCDQEFYHNGVDRINNDIGYIDSNCITACGNCNHMKFKMTQEDFLGHIKKIFYFQSTKDRS